MSSKVEQDSGQKRLPLLLRASLIAKIHTLLAYTAFITALLVGSLLHYKKIVKNGVAGYPEEWFPSVSATIGDWYPERNLFQILIAVNSGPRFILVILQYYLTRSPISVLPTAVFVAGIIRTLSCGGWVYITSSDDHDVHDVLMLTYIVANVPWMIGGIFCTPNGSTQALKLRTYIAASFFLSIIPMVYFFIQHKVYEIPGAYTHYSFFEWGLIFLDVLYDSVAKLDFDQADLQIIIGPSFNATSSHSTEKQQDKRDPVNAERTSEDGDANVDAVESESVNVHNRSWRLIRFEVAQACRPMVSFASDVYLSYIFWSIFTSLIPTLFYFSVWELGIAGHELALLTTLSPILLTWPTVLCWARSRRGRSVLHALSFTGLAAYALDQPIHRLIVVAFANFCVILNQAAYWAGDDDSEVAYQAILMGVGLILSSLSKHANHSNNPVWPMLREGIGGYNKTGLFVAIIALYELNTRPVPICHAPDEEGPKKNITRRSASPVTVDSWLVPAISLGSLLFGLHNLLADSSTLIAWSWTGFTNNRPDGPIPHLHSSLTLIAQCVGLLIPVLWGSLPIDSSSRIRFLWLGYGIISSFVMFRFKNWIGYSGGLNLAVFLMSVIPLILMHAARGGNAGKTYFTAWSVYCLFSLANVWTVAYAFVPGGVYLRERTDLVLISQMIGLSLVFWWPYQRARRFSYHFMGSYFRVILALFSVLSVLVTLYRLPREPPRPYKPGPRILTAGVWTLHFGIDNEGRDSQRGVRDLIRDMEVDIVGLLETDLHRPVFGHRDLTRIIAEELVYYVDLGPGPNLHTWGAALLSKFPIINSTHHLLPSPHGELAPAIEAILDVYGTEVTVVVAHNGQEEDPRDRELQSTELARIMAASHPRPVIFLGYVVTKPLAARPDPYEILVTDGQMHDIDNSDWDRWCEYILYRGLYRTSYARISRGSITDTELQVGRFVLPRHGHGVTNETEEAQYLRSWKEDLPIDHWFPMEYYGSETTPGKNGHYYHVFDTPLYYKIPDGAIL